MKTNFLFIIIVCLTFFNVKSQTNLNKFKYVIVPKKFDFLKTADQYQMNSLTKFLLEKENFNTLFDDETFPEDLAKDRCLAVKANVIDESKLFKTKLKVQLLDCRNNVIYESQIGDSKQKAYQKAYHESLREAFKSFASVNYSFDPKAIKKEESTLDKVSVNQQIKEVNTDLKKTVPVIVAPDTPEITEVKSEQKHEDKKALKSSPKNNIDILYAQTINNGFQLVDRTPKVVYTIYNSGKKDIYIVKGKDAVIYKLNDIWVISEMINESLKTESLNIKF